MTLQLFSKFIMTSQYYELKYLCSGKVNFYQRTRYVDHTAIIKFENLTICIKIFDKVKLSNFKKVKKVVVLDHL